MATSSHPCGALLIVMAILGSFLAPMEATRSHSTRKLQIAIPIYTNMTMLDAVGPYEILQTLPFVEVVFVSFKRGFISDLGSMTLEAKAAFHEIPSPDVVVVPGGLGSRGLESNTILLDWIRKVHKTTKYTTSVCTGGLLLGAAGILEGLDATTHWGQLERLASYGANPVSIRVVRRGKIITSAGVSSGIDMAIHLAVLLADKFTAQVAQLYNEYDPQPPFSTGTKTKATAELVAKALEWSAALTMKMNGTRS